MFVGMIAPLKPDCLCVLVVFPFFRFALQFYFLPMCFRPVCFGPWRLEQIGDVQVFAAALFWLAALLLVLDLELRCFVVVPIVARIFVPGETFLYPLLLKKLNGLAYRFFRLQNLLNLVSVE